jgi:hypothetical protein
VHISAKNKRVTGCGREKDKKMNTENMEHKPIPNCVDYLLTLKVERKNYIEILNTIQRQFAELGRTIPNPSLFLTFASKHKGDQVVPETSDLYRLTLDRKGYKRDETWGDLDALWRLGFNTITQVGS